jgi:hypothetical protein
MVLYLYQLFHKFLALISISHDLHSRRLFTGAQNIPPTINLLFKALRISFISLIVAFSVVNSYCSVQNCYYYVNVLINLIALPCQKLWKMMLDIGL